ncbi:regulatory protein RecX [Blastococcus sp. HT6-30]|uniref:regulatory protein RecX n=1 Tax=Blastococcus sp. HT6-30 TaxID=3144843 RepID=UPI00321A54BF
MDDRPSTRRRGSGGSRAGRWSRAPGGDDPLTPDVAPGSSEDDAGDPEQVARAICLRALTGAPKTRQQLADLLAKRGVPDDAAEAVLDRFTEVGLIDDASFARAWVSNRQAGRGLARRALTAELRAKGVDPETAAEAVEAVDDDDEREAARRLVARRVTAMRRLDRATAARRLIGMLARKGYNGGLAAAVVREALDEADLDGDVDDVPEFDEESALP